MPEDALFAEQPALDGLAVRKRVSKSARAARERAEAENKPAAHLPIARVVLDIQTPHLGKLFDYIIPEKFSDTAQPGTLIRARFGHQRCTGIIWERVSTSSAPLSALKPLERVLGSGVHVGAAMRADIEALAQYFGGSRANIMRLAVPPRVAKVEKELAPSLRSRASSHGADGISDQVRAFLSHSCEKLSAIYSGLDHVSHALRVHSAPAHILWDIVPGVGQWTYDLAWIAASAHEQKRPVVMMLPDMRHVRHMADRLESIGLHEFSRDNSLGQWQGDYAILNASLSAAERYRAYRAAADGLVGIIIGTRGAMYAPVGAHAVFISFHDHVYQNWDGFTPYPNVCDVLRIRAERSDGVVISAGYVRSRENQWQLDNHARSVIEVHGLPSVIKNRSAWVRHLNREELERLADPAVGARVPSVAVRAMREAVRSGPVLFSLPARSRAAVVCCASCRKVAQCRRCMGPLAPAVAGSNAGSNVPSCQWCAQTAENWSCRHCGSQLMRTLHVGTEGTAMELSTLIPGVPVIMSSPHLARGIIEEISDKPALVIATAGAEPVVRSRENGEQVGYQCVALVDAWTSLYGTSLDQRIDTLTVWSEVASSCVSHAQGGQVLILGEAEPVVSQCLIMADNRILVQREIDDAIHTALPPACAAAVIWGEKHAVTTMVSTVQSEHPEFAVIATPDGDLPGVLGPVSKAAPSHLKQQYMDGTYQRVQCVIRVPRDKLSDLVHSLHRAQAQHSATRHAAELHFHINPKNLL
ncbi:hypothetical protein [Alloscardovia omnicolens]|uniref:primosomal protein N' family DNA-binding protein n=1 Tax=Alloscardovia omnicolens TaxID=419015 RepID=UPI003A681C2A